MKDCLLITGPDCSKCHMIKPHVEKRANENGYIFNNYLFSDESVKEFKIESIPMLALREGKEVTQILDFDGIVNLLSNK